MEYLVMNSTTKLVENVAEWDGVTEWSPGTGYVALPRSDYPEAPHIGWAQEKGVWTPPVPQPAVGNTPTAPSIEQLTNIIKILAERSGLTADQTNALLAAPTVEPLEG